jgi:hypothetical protein
MFCLFRLQLLVVAQWRANLSAQICTKSSPQLVVFESTLITHFLAENNSNTVELDHGRDGTFVTAIHYFNPCLVSDIALLLY